MRRDDYILALTSGLLTADDAAFESAVAYFGKLYELRQPARPGVVSLAGSDKNGNPVDYMQWVKDWRQEGLQRVSFDWSFEQANPAMPAHIQAAFAGPQFLEMQMGTASGAFTSWRLQTLFAPQYEMTAEQFGALIDAQPHNETLWQRVYDLVNESNRLNDRPAVAAGQMREYLRGEGREVYNYIVSQLITEIQVELAVMDAVLVVPDEFQTLLYKSEFDSFYGPADDRVPVFLYPTGEVKKHEVIELVHTQSFSDEIWVELERSLAEYPLVNIPPTGYPAALDTLDEASVQELSHTVCRAIAVLCEQKNLQPVIPAALLHCIGPDELDGKRAQARSRLSGGKQLYLQSNQQPWELYLFARTTTGSRPAPAPDGQGHPKEYIRSHFISTLKQIAALAEKMQTPFVEAFSTAAFLLTGDIPSGQFDEAHEDRIRESLQQNGHSDQAIQIFSGNFSYIKDLHLLQWSSERLFGLCAISMADVFGGMGSWNDLDPGDDGLEYQRLSADLFETMKGYFATLLSSQP